MATKRVYLEFCSLIAVIALAMSCATTPKPTASPVVTEPAKTAAPAEAAKPAITAPDELRSEAMELRRKAFDLGLKDVLSDDYAAAEAAFSAGTSAYGVDNAAAGKSFSDASAKFRDVIKRGLPMLVASAKEHASQLRDTAMNKKAGDLFPDLFAYADKNFAKPVASESNLDYEAALTGYRASAVEFEALYKLCDASNARDILVSRDLTKWDTSNWNLAEAKYTSSKSLFRQDARASADAAAEAILRYGIAKDTAYGYYSADRKKASDTERDRAVSIKSDVAVKNEYAAALALYAKAESAESAKDYEASAAEYDSAATAFAGAYAHAKAKMDMAKNELDSLDSALASAKAAAAQTR